jgi:hypothetical protein
VEPDRQPRCERGHLAAIQAVWLRADVRALLPLVQVPTLVLHRRDVRLVPTGHGRYLAEHIPDARYVELPGSDDIYWVGDTDQMLDEIEEFLTGVRHSPSPDQILTAVLLIGPVASTPPAAEPADAPGRDLQERYRQIVRRHLISCEATSSSDQRRHGAGVLRQPRPGGGVRHGDPRRRVRLGVPIRAGIHTGAVEIRGEQMSGVAVDIAARAQALAEPRQVPISATAMGLISGSRVEARDGGSRRARASAEYPAAGGSTRLRADDRPPSGKHDDGPVQAEDRRIGSPRRDEQERQRVAADLECGAAGPRATHRHPLHAVQSQGRGTPSPVGQQVRDVLDARAEARPPLGRSPEGGPDVVGMHVRAAPQRFHGLADGHVVAPTGGLGPGRVIDAGGERRDRRADAVELVGQLGRAAPRRSAT